MTTEDSLARPAPVLRKPARRDTSLAWLKQKPFAHRGLHSAGGPPENSLAAFDAAIAAGYGIELDVQLTYDGDAVVFHDYDLVRMVGQDALVVDQGLAVLQKQKLLGSEELIPSLAGALMHIAGRAPLLIEAKPPADDILPICFAIRRALEGYRGQVAVMSYDSRIAQWFARHAPRVVRGVVASDHEDAHKSWMDRLALMKMFSVWRARPNFLAFDIRSLPSPLTESFRQKEVPVVSWTIRTEADHARALEHADNIIFEGPLPDTMPSGS